MFLTTVNLAKAKSNHGDPTRRLSPVRTVLVQMMSAAGTGYFFNTKRNRLKDKMVIRKHDPLVNKHVLFFEKRKIRSI
ncbi:39S ribosomal protein L33, mitochondrial isoform X1 [Scophthalmus maximus]|uniref:39S ribosomal protein L33, mitochondrial isoform X1 n=1 Tax=Scophthalmus maximus TaxID=52904 RepID=UPI0015E09B64|nr:39S ribosomal protein L33, mitochondrial isoform X1 [Scophthalmus maximus]